MVPKEVEIGCWTFIVRCISCCFCVLVVSNGKEYLSFYLAGSRKFMKDLGIFYHSLYDPYFKGKDLHFMFSLIS